MGGCPWVSSPAARPRPFGLRRGGRNPPPPTPRLGGGRMVTKELPRLAANAAALREVGSVPLLPVARSREPEPGHPPQTGRRARGRPSVGRGCSELSRRRVRSKCHPQRRAGKRSCRARKDAGVTGCRAECARAAVRRRSPVCGGSAARGSELKPKLIGAGWVTGENVEPPHPC